MAANASRIEDALAIRALATSALELISTPFMAGSK
jgi:hypothetical protein